MTTPTPTYRVRLRLKPEGPHSGYVDGAWWPHSADLTIEIPELLAALETRIGPVDRVLYKLSEWAQAPAKLPVGTRRIRLDGYRIQPPHTVEVLGFNRNRVVLLVVPPDASPAHAETTMTAAAAPDDDSTVVQLLGDGGGVAPVQTTTIDA
ncbi:DUF5994 family protein [Mycolicibacterium sp. Y3]